ncbi:MAG: hypothetical protein HYR57_06680 [Candidatus Koribacter versatilis]|nr:hypothetical protein [Candidatus Koribacter versatilis]
MNIVKATKEFEAWLGPIGWKNGEPSSGQRTTTKELPEGIFGAGKGTGSGEPPKAWLAPWRKTGATGK